MTTEECPEAIFVMSFQVNFLKFFNSYQHFVFQHCNALFSMITLCVSVGCGRYDPGLHGGHHI